MAGLTKKRFTELFHEETAGLLGATDDMVDRLYLRIMQELGEAAPSGAIQQFVKQYAAAYKQAFGIYPVLSGADQGAAKSIVKSLGLKDATVLMGTYLKMPDPFFRQRSHDLVTMAGNLNKIKTRHETGRSVTQTEARTDDRFEANKNAALDYLKNMGGEHGDKA